jgi:diguanylate cyclase (GGDEF)-like protein/PAS domain S-box-containing protein
LIDYAHELDSRVVAEGIETEAELAIVAELGADLGQGWYLGRPAADPARVERRLVLDAKAGRAQGATLEIRDRALSSATSGVVIADALQDGMPIIYANPAFERLTGYAAAEINGRDCKFVQGDGTDPSAKAEMSAAMREGRECRVTVLNYRKDGTSYWCEVHLSPVLDRRGRVLQYVGVQNDVTARVEAEQQLRGERDRARHVASHDSLTGLLNRIAFSRRGQAVLDNLTANEAAVVLFIDVDRFKRVNDHHGHDIGDEVLSAAGDAFSRILGTDALLARHAGDEFLALFTASDATAAQERATSIAERSTLRVLDHELAGTITASVGWAIACADEPRPLVELIREADVLMYDRKRQNRSLASGTAGPTG